MADTILKVDVDTKDATRALNDLKGLFATLLGGVALKGIADFADNVTNLKNRLVSINPDLAQVNAQFKAIAAIAMTARTPLNDTADLFYKMSRSAKDLGISQQTAADVTETLAKALTASGMSSAAAAGPLLQFGQAMQSGRFQGDELRSILEGLGPVATALADSLGVPVGALKDLGSKGMISAQQMVTALQKAKGAIDEAFARTTPTISQAFTTVKTAAGVVFNEFESNTKTGASLALSIEYIAFQIYKLSKNIDDIIGPIGTFVKIVASIAAFTLAGKILSTIGASITFLIRGVTSAGSAWGAFIARLQGKGLVEYLSNIKAGVGVLETWGRTVIWLLKPLGSLALTIGTIAAAAGTFLGLDKVFDFLKSLGDTTSDGGKELANFRAELEKNKTGLDDTAGSSKNTAYQMAELAKKLALVSSESRQQVGDLALSLKTQRDKIKLTTEQIYKDGQLVNMSADQIDVQNALFDIENERLTTVKKLQDEAAKLSIQLSQVPEGLRNEIGAKELSGRIGIINNQVKETNKLYENQKAQMPGLITALAGAKMIEEDRKRNVEIMVKGYDDQIKRIEALASAQQSMRTQQEDTGFARSLQGLGGYSKQIRQIDNEAKKAARAASAAYAAAFEDTGDGLTAERNAELVDGLTKIQEGYAAIRDAQVANLMASKEWETGWREAFQNYADNANDAAKQATDYFSTFTKGWEDAIVNFVKTGKLSFKDLANSMIAEFAKIQAQKMFVSLFGGTGNMGGGLLGSLFGGLFGKAGGGAVNAGQPYMVGESGRELFVPNSAGRIMPEEGGAGRAVNVTYNINATDAASFRTLVARDPQFIYNVTEAGRRSQPSRRLA
jgi:lambda family phage tail tape measure protein